MTKPRPSYAQKLAVIKRQQNGATWREALAAEGVNVTIRTAQRWAQLEREQGAGGARDQRGGVKWKVTPSLRHWIVETCEGAPELSSNELQQRIVDAWGIEVSRAHLNRVRGEEGVRRQKKSTAPD
ncbi:MAG: helix-turn-helix domain-containing protein [Chloroflexi bacterium]|nr:helix-turn-helix domain-containing protein [Chloroflexota bacterium]